MDLREEEVEKISFINYSSKGISSKIGEEKGGRCLK